MAIDFTRAPFPLTYRNLWLPQGIRANATWPDCRYNGTLVDTLIGPRKGTTCDGVHGDGSATSNIVTAADAVLNNQTKLWIFLRFKFDQTFSSAAATDQYICTKRLAADDYVDIWFSAADGKLYFQMGNRAAGIQFTLTSTTTSWTGGGVEYTVLLSLTDTGPAQRMLIDGIAEDTDAVAAINTSNGGDLVILSSADGNADGFEGVVSLAVIGTDDLTGTEETNLNEGIPPLDSVNLYMYDEGRGAIAYGRGTGADNGTLDTACTWAFGQVQQPVLSLDGINDWAQSALGIDITGDISLVWVFKARSTYPTQATRYPVRIEGSLETLTFLYGAGIRATTIGSGVTRNTSDYTDFAIGDYKIFILSLVSGGNLNFFVNGYLFALIEATGVIGGANASLMLNRTAGVLRYSPESHLLIGLIDGAFTAKQVRDYSRYIRNIFNLPIVI